MLDFLYENHIIGKWKEKLVMQEYKEEKDYEPKDRWNIEPENQIKDLWILEGKGKTMENNSEDLALVSWNLTVRQAQPFFSFILGMHNKRK